MLNIITSKNGELLKTAVFSLVQEYNTANKRQFIVVPETFTYSTDVSLLNFLGVDAIIDTKIVSFQRLTQMYLAKNGGLKRDKIDDIGKSLIIRKIIMDNPEEFSIYKNVADQEGFLSMIVDFICNMKSSLISGEELKKFSENNIEDSILQKKLDEIEKIYLGLEEYLKDKYVDNEDRLNQFLEAIDEDESYIEEHLLFFEFSGFSNQEYEIIKKLLRKNKSVTIGLLYGEGVDSYEKEAFLSTKEVIKRLKHISADTNTDFNIRHVEGKNIEKEYEFISELYPEDEVRRICGYINIIANKNNSYNKIGIVVAEESYKDLFKKSFDEYDIPYFINKKINLIYTPIARWIISVLDSVIYGFKHENVFEFLKLNMNNMGASKIEIFENFILRRNIFGEMYFKDKYFGNDSFVTEYEGKIVDEVLDYMRNGFQDIKKLKTKKHLTKDIVRIIFKSFENFQLKNSLENFILELEEKGLNDKADILEQSYGAIIDIIDQMVDILESEKISLGEFRILLEAVFRQKNLSVIPQNSNEVIVDTFVNGMAGEFDFLFIAGANSENLPQSKKNSSLLSPSETECFTNSKLEILNNNLDFHNEKHNIYRVVDKGQEKIIFSFSRIGNDGKKTKPSKYINYYNAIQTPSNNQWNIINDPQLYYISSLVSRYMEDGKIDEKDIELLYKIQKSEDLNTLSKVIFEIEAFGESDFKIEEATARLLYKEPLCMSVTRIQELTKCQFAHFIKYGLKARERDIASIEPRELGTLLHGFVESFVNEIQDSTNILMIDDINEIKKIISDKYDLEVEKQINEDLRLSSKNNYLINKLKRSAFTLGTIILEQIKATDFKPQGQEISFKEGGNIKPLILSDIKYDVRIEGFIDRLDFLNNESIDYFYVVDYKSNGKDFSISDVYNGIDNQLIIYAAAIMENYDNSKIAGAFYLPLIEKRLGVEDSDIRNLNSKRFESYSMNGIALSENDILEKLDKNINSNERHIKLKGMGSIDLKVNLFSEKEFVGLVEYVKNSVKTKVDELIKGHININPYITKNKMSCDYCRYKSICKVDYKWNKEKFNIVGEFSVESIKKSLGGEG